MSHTSLLIHPIVTDVSMEAMAKLHGENARSTMAQMRGMPLAYLADERFVRGSRETVIETGRGEIIFRADVSSETGNVDVLEERMRLCG